MSAAPERDLAWALPIVKAINQRAFFAMGLCETVSSLKDMTLLELIEATAIVREENDRAQSEAKATGRSYGIHVVPADRLIAAAYALEHFDGDGNAVAVIPFRNMFGEPCRKALGVVELSATDPDDQEACT